MPISDWSTTPASNNSAAPNGAPEGMNPSDVNDTIRQQMSDHRTQWEEGGFFNLGHTVTNVDTDTFRVANSHGDQELTYPIGRRVKISDSSTLHGTIAAVAYTGGVGTDVDVTLDSGSITASISAVSIGPAVESFSQLASIAGDKTFDGTVKGPFITNNVLAAHNNLVIIRPTAATVDIDASEILLEDVSANIYKASSVDLTVDITSSGVNGLDTGAESSATATWYYLWVIYNPTTDTVAGLISLSSTAPTMPTDYTYKGLVGAVQNDASDDFIDILQTNNRAVLKTKQLDHTGTNVGISAVTPTLTSPPNSLALITFRASAGSSGTSWILTETAQTDSTPSASLYDVINVPGSSDQTSINYEIRVNSSSQIRYRSDDTNADCQIFLNGWKFK